MFALPPHESKLKKDTKSRMDFRLLSHVDYTLSTDNELTFHPLDHKSWHRPPSNIAKVCFHMRFGGYFIEIMPARSYSSVEVPPSSAGYDTAELKSNTSTGYDSGEDRYMADGLTYYASSVSASSSSVGSSWYEPVE